MAVGTRRTEFDIIKEILSSGEQRTGSLRYQLSLNYSQARRYLLFLERSGLIRLERSGGRLLSFTVLDKGRKALSILNVILDMISVDDASQEQSRASNI